MTYTGHPPPAILPDEVRDWLTGEVRDQIAAARSARRIRISRRAGLACGATSAGGVLILSELLPNHLIPAVVVLIVCAVVGLAWMLALDESG